MQNLIDLKRIISEVSENIRLTCKSQAWHTTSNPALRKQREMHLCALKTSLVYIISSRPTRIHRETLSQKNYYSRGSSFPIINLSQKNSRKIISLQITANKMK